jgi:hypothetical protein
MARVIERRRHAPRELESGLGELRNPRRHVGIGEDECRRAQEGALDQRDVQRIARQADVRVRFVAFLGRHESQPFPVPHRLPAVGDGHRELL